MRKGVEVTAIGLAALILAMVAKHILRVPLGYFILSWVGTAVVVVGLAMIFSGRE